MIAAGGRAIAAVPWLLLGGAALVSIARASESSRVPAEIAGVEMPEPPVAPPAPGVVRGAPSPAVEPLASAATPPPMTPAEARDFRIRIAHEQCEQGAARINELEGRAKFAPDPKTLNELSICLRIGNVAWFKCILNAGSREDARACNLRFLGLDHPPL